MRLKKVLIGIFSGMFLMGGGYILAQQVTPPTECEIFVEGAKMASVKFSHQKHIEEYKVDCKVCHHKEEDPTKGVQKCSTCHGLTGGTEKAPNAPKNMLAYHKNCIDCHQKVNAEQGKAAPTKCNECHKK
ncbi:MAG: cytochrome C3 subunit A [Thermodesulfobacterium geofontis]|uniref:Cytochrome C3 subunit A n=2 Tax=Thermodesulfobacterium geofontis TaxID=1295609 RepID=A0A2N7PM53_9BACT|nr:MAG: cytochrome C3 subunit A [Thermodesulfobacterium geofontis]